MKKQNRDHGRRGLIRHWMGGGVKSEDCAASGMLKGRCDRGRPTNLGCRE